MTPRRLVLLFAIGFLVIVLAVWLSSKRHLERATSAGDLVLPGLEKALNSISQVTLAKGDATKTTLKKGDMEWTVGERGYAADSGKVRKLLLDLASLNVVEEKTRTPGNFPQLGVEDVNSPKATGTRVDAVTPGKTYSIIVGKSSGAKSGYVRVANSDQSLLAAPALSVDADPRQWLDKNFLDIAHEKIKEFDVKPADGPGYTAARATKDQTDFAVTGIPKGRELANPTAADPIAGSLANLQLDDVQHAPAQAPDPKAVAHATFKTFDGQQYEFAGHKEGSRTLIAVTSSVADENKRLQGWEFEVPAYKYEAMFRPLEDLLKKLPEKAKPEPKKTAGKPVSGPAPAIAK
ncbi:MAG TPA: DUF4340 domain-containing protein [Steroidobacteraceae bacterium]|jgi:hypothetical protein